MAVLELTKEPVFDLVRRMPAEHKREMLLLLTNGHPRSVPTGSISREEQLRRSRRSPRSGLGRDERGRTGSVHR